MKKNLLDVFSGSNIPESVLHRFYSMNFLLYEEKRNRFLRILDQAEITKSRHEKCSMGILVDQLKDIDYNPLLELCTEIKYSEIEAVDVCLQSSCAIEGDYVLHLMRAIGQKLRAVSLQDLSLGKDFFRDLVQNGLACEALKLRSSHFRNVHMVGEFRHLDTLILDRNTTITGFQEGCFSCMPKLSRLSMCETRVFNLWNTSAALSKLPSLVELRFQKWQPRNDVASSVSSSSGDEGCDFDQPNPLFGTSFLDVFERIAHSISTEDALKSVFLHKDVAIGGNCRSPVEDSTDDSDMEFSSYFYDQSDVYSLSPMDLEIDARENQHDEILRGTVFNSSEGVSSTFTRHVGDVRLEYVSSKASPICFEKHYREYMIASLPQLKVLDNLPIRRIDREMASMTFSEHYEYLPYRMKSRENVVNILQKREMRSRLQSSKPRASALSGNSQSFYTRSLCAAKVGSAAWPLLHSLPIVGQSRADGSRSFSPRQFEYHPSNPSLMVFGTLDGEVVVVNHENGKIVNYIPSFGALNSVLGLCWLKMFPSKLIAGSAYGSLKLYDIKKVPSDVMGSYSGAGSVTFEDFDQLTSVHVNSTDELFLASGYSKDVALYDISSGKRLQVFTNMHRQHINVVKFSNHSPSLFATSSFDQDVKLWDLRQKPIQPCYTVSSTKGNVMVCFSPDDRYLLASAVDNEVRQLLAVDGRVHLNFEIPPTGSSQNYTRSYYLNGRDYIISGSCDEHVIRICCAQTGRRLRDISLEGKGSGVSMFVQSLRGDPFRDFNMSILAAYTRPSSKSEIVKVNLLASRDSDKDKSHENHSHPSSGMGG